jgi:hypothetical protein
MYKCLNCGSEDNYTKEANKYKTPIWDGPHKIVGWEDEGAYVTIWCNICKWELEPTKEDVDRLFEYRKGIVWGN